MRQKKALINEGLSHASIKLAVFSQDDLQWAEDF